MVMWSATSCLTVWLGCKLMRKLAKHFIGHGMLKEGISFVFLNDSCDVIAGIIGHEFATALDVNRFAAYDSPTRAALQLRLLRDILSAGCLKPEQKVVAKQVIEHLTEDGVMTVFASDELRASLRTIARLVEPPSAANNVEYWVETRAQSRSTRELVKHFCGFPYAITSIKTLDEYIVSSKKANGFTTQIAEIRKELSNGTSNSVRRCADCLRIVAHFGGLKKRLLSVAASVGEPTVSKHEQDPWLWNLGSFCNMNTPHCHYEGFPFGFGCMAVCVCASGRVSSII